MVKKMVFSVVVLGLVGGGFFYWWQGHADERALNKTLPEGVRVDKCLLSGEYKVVNKIDGYKFKIPPEWQGIKEIEYVPDRTEDGYTAASISAEGNEGMGRIITIDRFRIENLEDINLELWAKTNFETFGLVGDYFDKDKIGEFEVIKTQEKVHLLGMHIYFFQKNTSIYAMTCGSEKFIREIILNGKW